MNLTPYFTFLENDAISEVGVSQIVVQIVALFSNPAITHIKKDIFFLLNYLCDIISSKKYTFCKIHVQLFYLIKK